MCVRLPRAEFSYDLYQTNSHLIEFKIGVTNDLASKFAACGHLPGPSVGCYCIDLH